MSRMNWLLRRLSAYYLTIWDAAAATSCALAVWIVVDTLRTILPIASPLPWLDDWSTLTLYTAWLRHEQSFADILFAPINEHHIVFPRLIMFADDMLFHARGLFLIIVIFVVQALHATLFGLTVHKCGAGLICWVIAAIVFALMFSLRQAGNFSSEFQIQFVMVFALASLSCFLFDWAAKSTTEGRLDAVPLAASLVVAGIAAFTMANGLIVAFTLVALAIMARVPARMVTICVIWAVLLSASFLAVSLLYRYDQVGGTLGITSVLSKPLPLAHYVANYLGGMASRSYSPASVSGYFGCLLTTAAVVRTAVNGPNRPSSLALVGIMLFCGLTAVITAIGRIQFGPFGALSSRYMTGSATFWAAQLTYWWTDPPAWALWRKAWSLAMLPVIVVLMTAMYRAQTSAKPPLYDQAFRQNDATNLLALGLDDPNVINRVSWGDDGVQALMPSLKAEGLSIFATPDVRAVGRAITERGSSAPANACSGGITTIVSDPTLGPNALRVSGQANEAGGRLVRRVLLADQAGEVVGLASRAASAANRDAWSGYAVLPPDAELQAYAMLADGRLCPLGLFQGPATGIKP